MSNQDQNEIVSPMNIKLPPVWPNNIDLWFGQVEAQFVLRNITADDIKYNHVVAVLDENVAQRAASLIASPPAVGKYDALKNQLIQRCGQSDLARAQKLLHLQGLGDLRPSELLTKM